MADYQDQLDELDQENQQLRDQLDLLQVCLVPRAVLAQCAVTALGGCRPSTKTLSKDMTKEMVKQAMLSGRLKI